MNFLFSKARGFLWDLVLFSVFLMNEMDVVFVGIWYESWWREDGR